MTTSEQDKARLARERGQVKDAKVEARAMASWRGRMKGTVRASRAHDALLDAAEPTLPLEGV